MCTAIMSLQVALVGIVLAKSSAVVVVDFQFLLDPKEAQDTLDKLTKVGQTVDRKRADWTESLQEAESTPVDNTDTPDFARGGQGSLQSSEYKEVLEKFGKIRANQEKLDGIRTKVQTATSFLDSMESLKNLLGAQGYIQFSSIRELIKTLRILSFDLFSSPAEAATDFGEICMDILNIRKSSVDLKKNYKELCF